MVKFSLRGVRIADFTHVGAGPMSSMYLAELGAEVIKIEPLTGDISRKVGPPWSKGESSIHLAFNRGKKSVSLDLKTREGNEIARGIIRESDIVMESFRPGVMERLGLGYAELSKDQKDLIYCSISAYGQSGPLSDRPGVDGIIQAASGLMSIIGHEGEAPAKVQAPIVDVATGLVATIGILAAFNSLRETGCGEHLDVSMIGSALALQQSAITAYTASGELPRRIGSAAPYAAPNEAFQAQDGWVMVAAYMGDQWGRLCAILGLPELKDDRLFRTSENRVNNRQAMRRALEGAFAQHSCEYWLERFRGADIMCSKVASFSDVVSSEHLLSRAMLTDVPHPHGGSYLAPAFPVNPAEQAGEITAPPLLGEHTDAVLTGLGYSSTQRAAFRQSGVIL